VVAAGVAVVAGLGRVPLLWDDPYPAGYDGPFYALQVRSTLAGAPLYSDPSLAYAALSAAAAVVGDVTVANKLSACAFAALAAAAGVVVGVRHGGSRAAGVTVGVWWACSPLHLGISAEYLKNALGVALLAWTLATLGSGRFAPYTLALLGIGVHKATGALGVAAVVAHELASLRSPGEGDVSDGSRRWKALAGVGLLVAALPLWGLVRAADVARLTGASIGDRRQLFSGVLSTSEALEAGALHLAPLALVVGWWLRGDERRASAPLTAALVTVAVACTAPGMAFGWDRPAWRLMLMGFLGVGAVLGQVASRFGWVGAGLVAALAVGQLPGAARHQARREPDYAAWVAVLPQLRASIPPGDRVVAHRGVCGFIWLESGVPCESYAPPPPHDGWWRVVWAIGPAALGASGPVVPLIPAYTLMPEAGWQRFRADHAGEYTVMDGERNPSYPRPADVYAPNR
jgi:hypothetical protein